MRRSPGLGASRTDSISRFSSGIVCSFLWRPGRADCLDRGQVQCISRRVGRLLPFGIEGSEEVAKQLSGSLDLLPVEFAPSVYVGLAQPVQQENGVVDAAADVNLVMRAVE